MQLEIFVTQSLFTFLLIFCRIGSAIMIMPGIGDSFVPTNVRLLFTLSVAFVMTPVLAAYLPPPPAGLLPFSVLIAAEIIVGLFIGTVMRILISALDTLGMMISLQSGFANALIFNAISSGQGSIVGALFSMMGVVLLLVTNLHHFLLLSIFESYAMFPVKEGFLETASMADVVARTVNTAFNTGVRMSAPFIVVGLLVYIGFGLLGRLMPQIQVFFLALPLQILLSLITLSLVFSAAILFWLASYEEEMIRFMSY